MKGRPLDDETELVRQACAGDIDAYDRLVAHCQDIAVRVAYLMCGSEAAADIAQEAFVKA